MLRHQSSTGYFNPALGYFQSCPSLHVLRNDFQLPGAFWGLGKLGKGEKRDHVKEF